MCGIAGLIARNSPPDRNVVERMGRSQVHRGPDNMNVAFTETAGFVHNRLSILDISEAAHQPFQDGTHILCYNGEIYNYQELRRLLESGNVRFRTTSDTEVLFHALVQWGIENTLKKIEGMFAFSFHDRAENVTYLARDQLGIKPLHWTVIQGTLYFASEIKAIWAVAPVELDPLRTLFGVARPVECFPTFTAFSGVEHIQPGTYLEYRPSLHEQPILHRYFEILDLVSESEYTELRSWKKEGVIERFASLFETSVRKMLMSDVPLGVFASGGLDSSLVSACASEHNQNVKLFTSNLMGRHSELDDAKTLAAHLGLPLHAHDFAPSMFVRDWVNTTWHYESPIVYFVNSIPFASVAGLAHSHGVKPILTGEGSDELFLGYPSLIYRRYLNWADLPLRILKKCYGLIPGLREQVMPEGSESKSEFLMRVWSTYDSNRFVGEAMKRFAFLPRRDAEDQCRTLAMIHNHLFGLLHRSDRMGMRSSIEARFPFLDMDLIRFGINLPHQWKIRLVNKLHNIKHPFHMDKYVVRATARRWLPPGLTRKPKWGFGVPGIRDMKVGWRLFAGGLVQSALKLTAEDLRHLVDTENGDLVGKLFSIDVFGRLFGLRQNQAEVESLVRENVSLEYD